MSSSRWTAPQVDAFPLRRPLTFYPSKRTVSNRLMKAAMTERLSSWSPVDAQARGVPSLELINLYRTWGRGDLGLIITGNIMIELDQLEGPGNAIIPKGARFDGPRFSAFASMAAEGKRNGSLMIGQLSHPGSVAVSHVATKVISASDISKKVEPFPAPDAPDPEPATLEEISEVIKTFGHAAEYLERAGFDGVEIHAGHTYLLSQFVSPETNKRTDAYGGSVGARARIVLEVLQEVRRRTSSAFVVGVKLNSADFQGETWRLEDARKLFGLLDSHGFDFVELSGGDFEQLEEREHKRESTVRREEFFVGFARAAAETVTRAKVYITGGFRTAAGMVEALQLSDGVGLGKPITHEPYLGRELLEGKVQAAIKCSIPDSSGIVAIAAAGAQMRRIAAGLAPVDFGLEQTKNEFMVDLQKWIEKGATDTEHKEYGFVEISAAA
ncbi:hypothetical protein B0J12DRAFT_573865 [Macrophomina phaseolina]|uniref:NADH:flavin oxidoreductase/NADH oxidase N-terminal domain-containing protein n=1 Tax=Macrophomina phaseolina TaxID=35725 RepID=A0ABQ8GAL9_9PEZI|nr:hypothetical protein B0J12DRAFT_573865 [Macrophomina phaseolina]